MFRRFFHITAYLLMAIVLLTGITIADHVPGPYGILELPRDYTNNRVSYREDIPAGVETEVASLDGEGCLRHLWMTYADVNSDPDRGLALKLRVYVDGREVPNVKAPVAPFFGIHHGHRAAAINSPYLQVTDRGGFNCYFPMPFADGIRITIENQADVQIPIWFQADFHQYADGSLNELQRFCTMHRRAQSVAYGEPFHVGHSIGVGTLVGLSMGMQVLDSRDSWYHCGGDLVLIDGGTNNARVLSGIGGEDFFGTAWGQDVSTNGSIGTPYYDQIDPQAFRDKPDLNAPHITFAAYRFFDKDPIAFKHNFSFDFGALENDISSVLYWYQDAAVFQATENLEANDRHSDTKESFAQGDATYSEYLTWDLVGPFDASTIEHFRRNEFPEAVSDFSQSKSADFGMYASAENLKNNGLQRTKWVRNVEGKFGFVDITPHFRPYMPLNMGLPTDASVYAISTVNSKHSQLKPCLLMHDDELRLWLNGVLVYDEKGMAGFTVRELKLPLQAGPNRIVAKVANHSNVNFRAWLFMLSFLETKDDH